MAAGKPTPAALEQTLAQLVYINVDLHGETSYLAIATEQTARPK